MRRFVHTARRIAFSFHQTVDKFAGYTSPEMDSALNALAAISDLLTFAEMDMGMVGADSLSALTILGGSAADLEREEIALGMPLAKAEARHHPAADGKHPKSSDGKHPTAAEGKRPEQG